MRKATFVLVPGFWLGAWAWEAVADRLRDAGHDVAALTLPGLESVDAARAAVRLEDHVDAVCSAIAAVEGRVVLVAHSGAVVPGYAATDRVPERITAIVYVDAAPPLGALEPEFTGTEKPAPDRETLEVDFGLTGLTHEQLETFLRQAIPEPGALLRDAPDLKNDARLAVPTTVVCTTSTSDEITAALAQGWPAIGGLADLHDVRYVDLPTSHWPMWSRPDDLAAVLADVAAAVADPA